MDAVAVDVPEDATGLGDLGINTGGVRCSGIMVDFFSTGAGCLSRIFCKLCIVRYACGCSEEAEEDEEAESSSMGGVMGRMTGAGDPGFRVGVVDRDRESSDLCRHNPRSVHVLALLLEPLRLKENPEDFGGVLGVAIPACCVTKEARRLYAGVEGSDGRSVNTGRDADAEVWKPE